MNSHKSTSPTTCKPNTFVSSDDGNHKTSKFLSSSGSRKKFYRIQPHGSGSGVFFDHEKNSDSDHGFDEFKELFGERPSQWEGCWLQQQLKVLVENDQTHAFTINAAYDPENKLKTPSKLYRHSTKQSTMIGNNGLQPIAGTKDFKPGARRAQTSWSASLPIQK